MKKWSDSIEIDAPIEHVWKLFDGSLEDMQKIMPNVIAHEPVSVTDDGVGSIYRQKFREGKRVEEYEVETFVYENQPDYKEMKVGFTLANTFRITAYYELQKLGDHKTYFHYETTNQPLKWYFKILVKLAGSNKIVTQFMSRVKNAAEEEYKQANT
ncbi:SRPBCC family protein [Lentibacillus sp. CBA3610]|uniref:SRPBCC family protein n=1 Tax=Lentibacillus sp. CBA3610 TaxID=2518176 RepID=UPI001594F06C|nr:SRPBCC family protein [Lentibacillus sp. CBA3610]QKY71130.1 SRPBCC family protein [Lentibacillus sp. CBA3610]